MKILKVLKLVLWIPFVQGTHAASTWYGFCYGKDSGKVYCSAVVDRGSDFAAHCKTWAKSHRYGVWGNHTATSTANLAEKQKTLCTEVEGSSTNPNPNPPPRPTPPTQPNPPTDPTPPTSGSTGRRGAFSCLADVLCLGPGPTSTVHLDPMNVEVQAANEKEAQVKCLAEHSAKYVKKINEFNPSNCYFRISASKN